MAVSEVFLSSIQSSASPWGSKIVLLDAISSLMTTADVARLSSSSRSVRLALPAVADMV